MYCTYFITGMTGMSIACFFTNPFYGIFTFFMEVITIKTDTETCREAIL